MKRNPEGKILDAERLRRISYIVGIYVTTQPRILL
jgi:hypothetical protein